MKAFVMFVTFLLFQSNLYVVLARGKGPKNSIHRDLFKTKNHKQNLPKPSAAFYTPYSGWVGLQPNWFFQMPKKRHLPKICSQYSIDVYLKESFS